VSGRPQISGARLAGLVTAAVLATAAVGGALWPQTASAHALIGKQDLPVPEWLFIYGTLVILVVSFVGLLIGWREPRFQETDERPLERFSRVVTSRPVEILAGLLGVALLVLVVYSGIDGTEAPDRNFSLTFVFVTFWIGLVLLSAIFGEVFRALSPWRAIGRFVSWVFLKVAGQRAPAPLTYPERLGRWPAVAGLLAFLFLYLIWGQSGFSASGLTPRTVAVASLVYSAYTLLAMSLFGVDKWVERGETFSVYFGMFATLSPLGLRDGRIVRRRWLTGGTQWSGPAGSLALVLVAIGGTTFDGAQEGVLKEPINSLFQTLNDAGMDPVTSLRVTSLVYLTVCLLAVAAIFWAGILGMRIVERKLSARELGKAFAHAFIPIALAYIVAHYFSYFVYLEQAQFTFLLSDPLGTGANIFGTAGSGIDYGVIDANTIWYVQVGALVTGHVLALVLGHDRALKIWGNTRDASWSQVWMLVMMMFFSVLGLVLLSQANG
jgi:hypothetical protein